MGKLTKGRKSKRLKKKKKKIKKSNLSKERLESLELQDAFEKYGRPTFLPPISKYSKQYQNRRDNHYYGKRRMFAGSPKNCLYTDKQIDLVIWFLSKKCYNDCKIARMVNTQFNHKHFYKLKQPYVRTLRINKYKSAAEVPTAGVASKIGLIGDARMLGHNQHQSMACNAQKTYQITNNYCRLYKKMNIARHPSCKNENQVSTQKVKRVNMKFGAGMRKESPTNSKKLEGAAWQACHVSMWMLGKFLQSINYMDKNYNYSEIAKTNIIAFDETNGARDIRNGTSYVQSFPGIEPRTRKTKQSTHFSLGAGHDLNMKPIVPLLICKGKHPHGDVIAAAMERWREIRLTATDEGYMVGKVFFQLIFKLAEERNVLLECIQKHIWIFLGPPNATHIYQTCDNQIFKMYQQIRKYYKQKWTTEPHYPEMKLFNEVEVSVRALKEAMTPETIASSCKAVGLLPFDPDRCKRAYGEVFIQPPINENIPDKKPNIHTLFPAGGIITNEQTIKWLRTSGKKDKKNKANWVELYKQFAKDNKDIFDI